MARKKKTARAAAQVQSRKPRAAKEAKQNVAFSSAVWTPHGLHITGQGADGKVYAWDTTKPAQWRLMEAAPMTQEQSIALQLKAQQDAEKVGAVNAEAPKRALRVAAGGVSKDEAFE